MRSREALAALLLVIIIAAPVVAYQPRRPDEPAWVAVPVPRASAQPSHVADRTILDTGGLSLPPMRPSARPMVPVPVGTARVVERRVDVGRVRSSSEPRTARGIASRMGSGFGHSYLALPEGKGHRVRICGAAACWTMTSTDAGPDKAMQRAGRVADLNDWVWAKVSGLPLSRGLAKVTVTYL